MHQSKFKIRFIRPDDHAFIYATWLRGLYYGNPWFREIDKDTFFKKYHIVIENILATSHGIVVCLSEDEDVVLGYSIYHDTKLHWVYVKDAWRKMGVAKLAIPKGIDTVTHLTKIGKAIKPKDWKFDPFAV